MSWTEEPQQKPLQWRRAGPKPLPLLNHNRSVSDNFQLDPSSDDKIITFQPGRRKPH